MTFEARFFGPGNRLRWTAIQAGTLSREVQDRLAPFLDDLRRNPDVLALPRVRDDGLVQWYVLCASPRAMRVARDETRAFLGPTYSDSQGGTTQLDPTDPVDAAVLESYGNNAFKVDVPDREVLEIARDRLRLMMRLQEARPVRHARRVRAVGRVLRDFEYALLAADGQRALELIDELRSAGHLGATNLLFLEVRRLAATDRWDAVLALPELDAIVAMPRPRRVTEALINAVYAGRLQEFEEGHRAAEAIERFRTEIWPRFRELYRSRATLSGFPVDASFLMAAAATVPARPDVANTIVAAYPSSSREHDYLAALGVVIPITPSRAGVGALDEARAAFAEADIDRAYELAAALPPSFDRSALLLRCARENGSLAAAEVALRSIASLSAVERSRLDRNATLSRIRDSLEQLSVGVAPSVAEPAGALEFPSTWAMWLRRLTGAVPWPAAVAIAETAAREWSVDAFTNDSAAVQEVADLLLADRPQWAQAVLRDSLPYLLEFCLAAGADFRLKPVYESLFLVIAVDDQVSLPQTTALLRVVDLRLRLGVTADNYREMTGQLSSMIYAIESPSVVPLALDAVETLINTACPAPPERQEFLVRVAGIFHRWRRRIDKSLFALLRQLATELEVADAITVDTADEASEQAQSSWGALDGKRVAMYSLQESALRRAALVLGELCPGARISTFHDHVGGSAALRAASAAADVFVLATAAAKHAATTFIEQHRPKSRPTIYARGQGSASLLGAIREYITSRAN